MKKSKCQNKAQKVFEGTTAFIMISRTLHALKTTFAQAGKELKMSAPIWLRTSVIPASWH